MTWRKGEAWLVFAQEGTPLHDTLIQGDSDTVLELRSRRVGEAEGIYAEGLHADIFPRRMNHAEAVDWLQRRGFTEAV
jgi:hypothetical protein